MTSFTLNEEAARDWVTSLIVAYELADLDTGPELSGADPMPNIGLAWRPREPGQEDAVADLVRRAQHQSGVLAAAESAEVAIMFVDDGDDWSYHFLLHVRSPVPVTLAFTPKEVCRIGDDSAIGLDAAIGILREATQTANALLEQLNAFVKATVRDA